ncbi:MAG: hypothetical protein ACXVCP_15140 [Bdellovibrio sp.]
MKILLVLFAFVFAVGVYGGGAFASEVDIKEGLKIDATMAVTAALDSYMLVVLSKKKSSDHSYKFMCETLMKAKFLLEINDKYNIGLYDGAIQLAIERLGTLDLRGQPDGTERTINLISLDLEKLRSKMCK